MTFVLVDLLNLWTTGAMLAMAAGWGVALVMLVGALVGYGRLASSQLGHHLPQPGGTAGKTRPNLVPPDRCLITFGPTTGQRYSRCFRGGLVQHFANCSSSRHLR